LKIIDTVMLKLAFLRAYENVQQC